MDTHKSRQSTGEGGVIAATRARAAVLGHKGDGDVEADGEDTGNQARVKAVGSLVGTARRTRPVVMVEASMGFPVVRFTKDGLGKAMSNTKAESVGSAPTQDVGA